MKKILYKYLELPIAFKATAWYLFCTILQKGISVITTPVFTRIMSIEEYGQYSVFDSWLSFASIIISLNLSYGVYVQGMVKLDDERMKREYTSSLEGLTLILCVLWGVLIHFFYFKVSDFISLSVSQIIAMIMIIWSTAVYNFWGAEQRLDYKYKQLVLVTAIVSILRPSVGIIVVLNSNRKVDARIWGVALVNVFAFGWIFFVHMAKGKKIIHLKNWKYAIGYNIPLIPHYLSQMILNNSDRIMINKIVGQDKAGIYSLAYSIAMLMTMINSALAQTLNPWIFNKIKNRRINDISFVAYPSIIIICVINIVLIFLVPEVVRVFAPIQYYEAIFCIPPIVMSVPFMFTYELFAKFAFYYEKTVLILIASLSGALLNIFLNCWGIKKFGYYAAAYTTLVCYIIYSIFHYILMRRICALCYGSKSPYDVRILSSILILFLAISVGVMYIYRYIMLRYTVLGILFSCCIIKRKVVMKYIRSCLRPE